MRWHPKSLRGKLVFYGALTVLVAVALVTYLNFRLAEREVRSALQRSMAESAALIISAIETVGDVAAVQTILENCQLAEEEGHEVLLVDREGMVIASSRRESVGRPIEEAVAHAEMELRGVLMGERPFATEQMVHRGVRVLDLTLPVHGDPSDRTAITGVLHYVESYAEYTGLVRRALAGYLLLSLLLLALLLGPFSLILRRAVLAPLRQLEASNRAVTEGRREGMSIPDEVIPDDEIGRVMRTRNAMLARLEAHARKLAESDRALESMLEVVVVANPDGTIRTVNRAALELLDYAEEELIGQPVDPIFEEETFFKGSGLTQLVREGAVRDVELTLVARSGERIPVVFNGSVIREEDGRLACVVGVARDMREIQALIAEVQHRAGELDEAQDVMFSLLDDVEQARRALEEYSKVLEERVEERTFELEMLYELSQQLGYTLHYDELFRLLLNHLHRAVAYDVGASILVMEEQNEVFIHPVRPLAPGVQADIEARLRSTFEQMSGQKVDSGKRHFHPAETFDATQPPITHLDSFFQVPLSTEEKTVGILFVGAERKEVFSEDHIRLLYTVANQASQSIQRLRALLAVEQQRLEGLVENLPEGVCLLDGERRLQITNPVARTYLSVLAEAEIGEVVSHLGGCPLEEVLAPRENGLAHELVWEGPPQQVFEVRARPILGRMPESGWVLVIREVTQEREIQERVQQHEQLAVVGQMAAGISHDFNNLLTGILGYTQLLQMRTDLPQGVKEQLESITRQGQRAAQLIRQILDFSRQSILQPRPLDLVPLLKETATLLKRTIPENIQVVLEVEPGDYWVNADAAQIHQVLTNLAVNARDAMPKGGTLRIALSRLYLVAGEPLPSPELSVGPWAVLRVSDTGTGMTSEVLEHIYEPFFTTKGPGEGTGLGLAQVYGIVRQHKGDIRAESRPGEGTTFTIYLPALTGPNTAEEEETEEIPLGQRETILVVEDEEAVLEVTKAILERLNYRVLTATNGKEALSVYENHRTGIALVLTDMVMPDMGGVELFHALQEWDPEIKTILTTGYPLEEQSREVLREGIVDWIQKPCSLPVLAQTVARVLNRKKSS